VDLRHGRAKFEKFILHSWLCQKIVKVAGRTRVRIYYIITMRESRPVNGTILLPFRRTSESNIGHHTR
jgi:hypothetical protein